MGESLCNEPINQRLRAFGGDKHDLSATASPCLREGDHSHEVASAHLATGIGANDEGRHGSEEMLFFEELVHELGSLPILFVVDVLHSVRGKLH